MPDNNNPEIKKSDTTTSPTDVNEKTSNINTNTPIPTVNIGTKEEIKYSINELIENSKALTGQGKEVAVGALFNCKEKEFTKDDFKKKVKGFLERKVK